MPTGARIVQEQFPFPSNIIQRIKDKNIVNAFSELHKMLDDMIKEYSGKINDLMCNRRGDTLLIIPIYNGADPTGVSNGQIWYRKDLGTFRCFQNGSTKTFTTS